MRISDWSSYGCSSDLDALARAGRDHVERDRVVALEGKPLAKDLDRVGDAAHAVEKLSQVEQPLGVVRLQPDASAIARLGLVTPAAELQEASQIVEIGRAHV